MGRPRGPAANSEEPILCLCLTQARTPDIVLVAAEAGFDAVYVDLEHGVTPLDVTSMLCRTATAAGLVPYVRVPSSEAATITRVLDGGAQGIIVPHVEGPDEAASIVAACRFPPVGRRSLYGAIPTSRATATTAAELTATLESQVVVVPMIESAAAVDAADAIAAVDGVDMLLVGVHDLGADLGVDDGPADPKVRAALDTVADACAAHKRRFGVAGLGDPTVLGELFGRGLGFVSSGTDIGLLAQAATERVDHLRGLFDHDTGGGR